MPKEHITVTPEQHARGNGGDDNTIFGENRPYALEHSFRLIQVLKDIRQDDHIEFFRDGYAFQVEYVS